MVCLFISGPVNQCVIFNIFVYHEATNILFLLILIETSRRILIFPKGNNAEHLSMYIDVADSSSMPFGWTRFAQFSLSVVNQVHSKYTIRKGNFCNWCSLRPTYLFVMLYLNGIRIESTLFCGLLNVWET